MGGTRVGGCGGGLPAGRYPSMDLGRAGAQADHRLGGVPVGRAVHQRGQGPGQARLGAAEPQGGRGDRVDGVFGLGGGGGPAGPAAPAPAGVLAAAPRALWSRWVGLWSGGLRAAGEVLADRVAVRCPRLSGSVGPGAVRDRPAPWRWSAAYAPSPTCASPPSWARSPTAASSPAAGVSAAPARAACPGPRPGPARCWRTAASTSCAWRAAGSASGGAPRRASAC